MAENPPPSYEDEIDLRAILQTIWKARIVILVSVLVPAIAAFAVSAWSRPATYQAAAYVFIGNPPVGSGETTIIPVSAYMPDIKAVVQLATAPGLLKSVTQDPALLDALGVQQVSFMTVTAVDVSRDQLRLQVTDTDPQRAALLANAWAAQVVATVNATYYGIDGVAEPLDSQVAQSLQTYAQAQAALEKVLSDSQVDAVSAQLQNKQADLQCALLAESNIGRLLDDLQALQGKWEGMPAETPVSSNDALVLMTLRQRSLTSQPCQRLSSGSDSGPDGLTLQIDGASIVNLTVSEALAAVAEMQSALEAQTERLQSEQARLEGEIPPLQVSLEKERASLAQITLKRDQAYALYADLLNQQERATTILARSTTVGAVVSVPASTPQGKVSRNVTRNTLVIAFLGLVLSVFAILSVDWWRSERPFPV